MIAVASSRKPPYLSIMPYARLFRTVLKLSGEGVREWLDGLLTNAVSGPLTFAALLTPQGKIIADLFVTDAGDHFLLDTPEDMGAPLLKRLKMYRLRAPIEIGDLSDSHKVYALWDVSGEIGAADPRLPALGSRLITDQALPMTNLTAGDYDAHRLALGVPDSAKDFGSVTTFPADACMDQLNGVNFSKGCFVGQEVVSRMKRMTTVRKRMRGVVLSGPAEAGDKIKAGERAIGQILHAHEGLAMALIRLDRWREASESPSVRGAPVQIMDSVLGTDD